LLGAAQKNNKNIFDYLPEDQRPLGFEQLDEFLSIAPNGEEGDTSGVPGGGDLGSDGGDDDTAAAELDAAAAEGGFEEPQTTDTETPDAETDTNAETPELASTTIKIKKGTAIYTEELKKQAEMRKKEYLEKQKEMQEAEQAVRQLFYEKEELKKNVSKRTKIFFNLEYFENQNEFIGLNKVNPKLKYSYYGEDTIFIPNKQITKKKKTLTKKKK